MEASTDEAGDFVSKDKFKIENHKYMRSNGCNKGQAFSPAMTEKNTVEAEGNTSTKAQQKELIGYAKLRMLQGDKSGGVQWGHIVEDLRYQVEPFRFYSVSNENRDSGSL